MIVVSGLLVVGAVSALALAFAAGWFLGRRFPKR